MAEALLEVRHLAQHFAAVDALKQLNFCLEAGELDADHSIRQRYLGI